MAAKETPASRDGRRRTEGRARQTERAVPAQNGAAEPGVATLAEPLPHPEPAAVPEAVPAIAPAGTGEPPAPPR